MVWRFTTSRGFTSARSRPRRCSTCFVTTGRSMNRHLVKSSWSHNPAAGSCSSVPGGVDLPACLVLRPRDSVLWRNTSLKLNAAPRAATVKERFHVEEQNLPVTELAKLGQCSRSEFEKSQETRPARAGRGIDRKSVV